MNWLGGIHDRRLKLKWDHVYKNMFRFRNGPFGFEIIEILIRTVELGVTLDSDTDKSNSSSSEGTEGTEISETGETREKLAVTHQEFAELHKMLTMRLSSVAVEA